MHLLGKGLYVITDQNHSDFSTMLNKTEKVLAAGAKILQYRSKQTIPDTLLKEAQQLQKICHKYHVPLIINNNVTLATQIHADGIHLGKTDMSVATARRKLGGSTIIGCSCYNDLDRAREAVATGADYLAFGAFFKSPNKPLAVRADLSLIQQAKREFSLPVVTIGGITPKNGVALIDAGADILAVISGIYTADDPSTRATEYIQLFDNI